MHTEITDKIGREVVREVEERSSVNISKTREIQSSHSGTDEDESIVESEAMSLGEQLHRFEGFLCLNLQGQAVRKELSLLRLIEHTNEAIITLLKIGNYLPKDTVPRPRIPASSFSKQFTYSGFLSF
jgi:hypothetical protein